MYLMYLTATLGDATQIGIWVALVQRVKPSAATHADMRVFRENFTNKT